MMTTITPNADNGTANDAPAVSDESIASKMAAMRNQVIATRPTAPGPVESEAEATSPVTPEGLEDETNLDSDMSIGDAEDVTQQDAVSEPDADSSSEELIDFIEFAETNPNAKFKFTRNGKEVVIDAKKAASILGQGGAIHEEARQLKVERSEFDEFVKEQRARQEGLTLAMEFTVQPQLQKAYDEIVKTQGYQTTFHQQLSSTQDPAQQARIQASMQQNEQYIQQQQALIGQLKPAVDEFRTIRKQQVQEVLENTRKGFTDKELRNEFVYNELRGKIEKLWTGAKTELIPGVPNIDLIASDETLLGLVRDGLKYRSKPQTRQAGSSIAQLTQRKGTVQNRGSESGIEKLREQAKKGGKEGIQAADNLLVQRLSQIRSAARGGR
jgi:hypothetical protein